MRRAYATPYVLGLSPHHTLTDKKEEEEYKNNLVIDYEFKFYEIR